MSREPLHYIQDGFWHDVPRWVSKGIRGTTININEAEKFTLSEASVLVSKRGFDRDRLLVFNVDDVNPHRLTIVDHMKLHVDKSVRVK
jgi:hypothetical protein